MVHNQQGTNGRGFGAVQPLIIHVPDRCSECWGCARHCPARAIRVIDGRTEIIEERCVKCGACVTECGNGARIIRDDLGLVRELLEGETPVVMLLASEYIAALHPLEPTQVEVSLCALGFEHIETTVVGEEIVAAAYEQVHATDAVHPPRLRSTCPVAVDWVRFFHPALTGALVPLVPPYIAQSRVIRDKHHTEVAIVYASPCWARKDEALAAEYVDVVIGFDELRKLVAEGAHAINDGCEPGPLAHRKELSATDGFPRRTLQKSNLTDRGVAVVRGLRDIDRFLTAISRGEVFPEVVDMLSCESCIDGPCVNAGVSVFAKRNIDLAERERMLPPRDVLRLDRPTVDLRRSFSPDPAMRVEPSDAEIDQALAAGEFFTRNDALDCGACGYDTCIEHAASVCLGNSSWDACFPLARRRLTRERERLESEAVTDDLTGLFNRRAFNLRLEEEVGRSRRYGNDLALIMLDLDGFKGVNDTQGHAAGDTLLRSVGVLLKSELRATDIAFRYGGDEFALVLAATTESDAWVVAEKLRTLLGSMVSHTEHGMRVSATASLGVAAFGPSITDPQGLLSAADAALYRAKRRGRNRVELASRVQTH
ncbi:MAG: diguanylate cyclase [Coriobacteriia bacterium]|nr:diguanylate cyclase [Coriobacteriia bacterium]